MNSNSDHEAALARILELENEINSMSSQLRKLGQEKADYAHSWAVAKRRFSNPSFYKAFSHYKDFVTATEGIDSFKSLPTKGLTNKLRNYAFAQSHGMKIPSIFVMESEIEKINLSTLPDQFVLKTSGGSTSHGVLPLFRTGRNEFKVADGSRTLSDHEIIDFFKKASASGLAYGKVFAEEFLHPMNGEAAIPDDIKIYMAYGEVMHVLLRSVDVHGSVNSTRSKYVDEQGNDLGPVSTQRLTDPAIEVPSNLPKAVEFAKHLSRASGLPFCRIDVFHTSLGTIFGELTRAPGGAQSYIAEHDRLMGKQWLLGQARLLSDYQNGRPFGAIWGTNSLADSLKLLEIPGEELTRATFRPCGQWCLN